MISHSSVCPTVCPSVCLYYIPPGSTAAVCAPLVVPSLATNDNRAFPHSVPHHAPCNFKILTWNCAATF